MDIPDYLNPFKQRLFGGPIDYNSGVGSVFEKELYEKELSSEIFYTNPNPVIDLDNDYSNAAVVKKQCVVIDKSDELQQSLYLKSA